MSLFTTCQSFQFHTISEQAEAFVEELSSGEHTRALNACESIANCLVDDSPPVRSRLVKGARMHDLFAILVDWPGASGPKVRLLAKRDGDLILIARGLRTDDGRIGRREVERAERAIAEHRSRAGDRAAAPRL